MMGEFGSFMVAATIALAGLASIWAQTPSGRGAGTEQHQQSMKGMTEAEFVPMMIKHHQDGIQMTQLEEKGGSSGEVKALATKIRQSQEQDLPELKRHSQHGGPAAHEGHDKMMEQQSAATMKRLKSASGQALDHAFLEEMAKHHEMAIGMAESAKIQSPDLKNLVQKMIAGQRQELGELKKLLSAHAR